MCARRARERDANGGTTSTDLTTFANASVGAFLRGRPFNGSATAAQTGAFGTHIDAATKARTGSGRRQRRERR